MHRLDVAGPAFMWQKLDEILDTKCVIPGDETSAYYTRVSWFPSVSLLT